ncbi:MAG: 6-carboxytetrahydropterin synthase [Myxococcota bacterium]
MISLTRRYRFPAAHVLRHASFSDAENRAVYGKCANPSGHGHNYGLEVTVAGEIDFATGQVFSRETLDRLVTEKVLDRFGHAMLNQDPAFADRVPTAENIALVVEEELADPIAAEGAARLVRVRLEETRKNSFETGELR